MVPEGVGQQVLELVLPAVKDIKTLAMCSILSSHFKDHVKSTVQLHLATLVQLCSHPKVNEHNLVHLMWLCTTAGQQQVNTHDAGRAVLDAILGFAHTDLILQLLSATGLVLTNKLLVHMAHKHFHGVANLLLAINVNDIQLDTVYLQFGRCAEDLLDEEGLAPQDLQALLCDVNRSNLPDLLHITCNNLSCDEDRAQAAADILLDHDRDLLHILHVADQRHTSIDSNTTRPSSCTRSEHASTSSQSAGQQHDPQQLAASLLEACILRANAHIMARLVDTPAAQGLGTCAVVGLMRLLLSHYSILDRRGYDGPDPCMMASLAKLPGAKAAPAGCLAALLCCSIHQRRTLHIVPLLQLPNAKQISSRRLCQLVGAAGRADMLEIVDSLGRLAHGRQLEGNHVVALLQECMREPWSDEDYFFKDLQAMASLDPGRHLSGDDVLELLEYSTSTKFEFSSWADICELSPARDQVQDVERFVNCIKAAVAMIEGDDAKISEVLDLLPIVQQVQPAAWFDIMLCSLKGPLEEIPDGVQQLDAVKQLNADQVGQLLQLAVQWRSHKSIRALCTLPAAHELPIELVRKLLEELLPTLPLAWDESPYGETPLGIRHFLDMLRLAPAQQMPAAAVHDLMKRAYACNNPLLADKIWRGVPCDEEAYYEPEADQLAQLLLGAKDLRTVWCLLECPLSQRIRYELSPTDISRVLVKLFALYHENNRTLSDTRILNAFAADHMQAEDLLQVIAACLRYGAGLLQQLLALPAAAHFTRAQLLELLEGDVKECSFVKVGCWQQLLQLPAAQQLDCADIARLLRCMARARLPKRVCSADINPAAGFHMLVGMLLLLPAAQCCDASTAAILVQACICWSPTSDMVAAAVLAKLPAVAQLSSLQLKGLIQEAIESGMSHLYSRFSQLVGAASVTDRELDMLLDLLSLAGPLEAEEAYQESYCGCPACVDFLP